MFQDSFIFLPGIGRERERMIWDAGIKIWDDFIRAKTIPGISSIMRWKHVQTLKEAQRAWEQKDYFWFATHWPTDEQWRLFDALKSTAVAIDIEVEDRGTILLVAITWDGATRVVAGQHPATGRLLQRILAQASVLLTFNGRAFDWPLLTRIYRLGELRIPHIDLYGVSRQCGLVGGLKKLELEVGIQRPEEVQGWTGATALLHLQAAREGEHGEEFLDAAMTYTACDAEHLLPLAEYLIPQLWRRVRTPEEGITIQMRP